MSLSGCTLTWLRLTLRKHQEHTAIMLAATMKLTTTPAKIAKMTRYSLLELSTGTITVVLTEWLPAYRSQETHTTQWNLRIKDTLGTT